MLLMKRSPIVDPELLLALMTLLPPDCRPTQNPDDSLPTAAKLEHIVAGNSPARTKLSVLLEITISGSARVDIVRRHFARLK